ncbi:uncharacterized protein At2g33490-like isoform X5 [Camellia sinensis]|uniref:uncharacterized protein At2g33490-like isoform X5 n=1 Tax=Camellia sinensis TaxID=4442 RepID=UPI0010363BDE|nr:uncharacterized protein At2g33490-like isoform X5 [Camellia sinensis]
MKSSLGMLRRFALHKSHGKEKTDYQLSVHLDDLSQASQDMHDMRNCYDSLLSAAAATANSAFGKILSMMGNVQFELQKLVDSYVGSYCYRSHVIQTITTPSESLLSELRTVEEMKRQCDEKRNLYKYMAAQQREKGRSKSEKEEVFTSQQLQAAHDEYDEEATLCIFRLKSLQQGQYRSLLTQAARHHAAQQLNFFRKGLKSLEAVEPHIRLVMEKQHIDYQLNGLDDGEDGEDEGVNSHETNDDGELSFGLDAVSTLRNSMELDQADILRPLVSTVEIAEVNLNKGLGEQIFDQQPRVASHSAPIFADTKFDPAERIREMQPSSARKFHSYVLPTPVDAKSSISAKTNSSVLQSRPTSHSGSTQSLWHSSPLEPEKHEKDFADDNSSVPTIPKAQSKLKESSRNNPSVHLPPYLSQGLSLTHSDTHNAYDTKKVKRQAFSGPIITGKPLPTKPVLSASGPITSTELPQLVSGLLSGVPTLQPPSSSPKVSPSASPPTVSSPKISELHELPRPPGGLTSKPVSSSIRHSAPLIFRNQEVSQTNKSPAGAFSAASTLPTPPLVVPRSFSIPSSNQRAMALHVAKLLESPQPPEKAEE